MADPDPIADANLRGDRVILVGQRVDGQFVPIRVSNDGSIETSAGDGGGQLPLAAVPTDADPNDPIPALLTRIQAWDSTVLGGGAWVRVPILTGPALAGTYGLAVRLVNEEPIRIEDVNAPPTFAAIPSPTVDVTAVRLVPTGSVTEAQSLSVVPPTGFWSNTAPADNERAAFVRTVGLVKSDLYVGGAPNADLNPITATTPAYARTSFGQIRVAQREVLHENVQTYGLDARAWATRTAGAGTVAFDSTTRMTNLDVSGASADVAEISTHTHFPYEPGATSHLVLTLKHSDTGQIGQTREWGFGTADDGFLFRLVGTDLFVVRRSSASGLPADEDVVSRASWDDPLDGSGPSGKTLDLTKIVQYEIDFQWLSAGVVRYWLNGVFAHELDLRGAIDLPETATGQLPLRITVENTDASAAATISYVCSVVYRDGGTPTRFVPGSYTLSTPKTAIGTTFTPVLGIRLVQTFSGFPNRKIVVPRIARVSNASGRGTVRLLLNPSSITGGTWNPVPTAPWIEYNEGITAITGGTIMTEAFLPNSADVRELDGDRAFALNGIHLRRVADNSSGDEIVFVASAYLGNIDIVSLLATFNTLG